MIVIKNRELLIPNNEQFIGTVYDNNADTRFFKIDRVLPGQIDLNNFTFVADVKYSNNATDSISLTKDSVTEDSIVLRMQLPASVLSSHVGNMAIQVRCSDTAGRTWSTAPANMYIMDQISNPGAVTSSTTLTELQQTETTIEASETLRISAETSRASAETGRVNAESARVIAENGRVTAEEARVVAESGRASAETVRANAETTRGNAETGRSTAESGRVNAETGRVNAESARVLSETARETAEANREATLATKSLISEGYAKGTQNDVPVTSESTYYHNNSKYFSEESASKASTADAKRLVSEGFANGQQNGVDVGAGSPYYHNNAKYFMEQAGSASGFVSYAVDQQLPDGAKQIARNNIDSYKKPSSGIPSSDMASAVQTSLGKADSAYQKSASGIPSTDMTSAVQTSLGKADTALQEHQSLAAYRTSSAQDVIDAGKAAAVHNHDDRYYTESEADSLFEDKADRADVLPLINIWDEQYEIGGYNFSTGEKTTASNTLRTSNAISVKPNTTYYNHSSVTLYVLYYGSNGSYLGNEYDTQGNATFTTPANAYFMRFVIPSSYGTTYNNDISINYPSTYHGYYPSRLAKVESRVTNRNLLDNPFFQVNQRNASSAWWASYGVDRWLGANTGYSVSGDVVSINTEGYLTQKLESSLNLLGKVVTGSVLYSDGSISTGSSVVSTQSVLFNDGKVMAYIEWITSNSTYQFVLRYQNSNNIKAAKLELGTVSTLHMDTAPNYGTEIVKCMASTADSGDTYANKCGMGGLRFTVVSTWT